MGDAIRFKEHYREVDFGMAVLVAYVLVRIVSIGRHTIKTVCKLHWYGGITIH